MCKSNIKSPYHIKPGDLVTYRTIKDITNQYQEKKILINGVGIVVRIHDNLVKVYWIHAQGYLWVLIDKLTAFTDLKALKREKY